jgi:hypothetical protein
VGLAFTLLGGFVAGRIAARSELQHSFIIGGAVVILWAVTGRANLLSTNPLDLLSLLHLPSVVVASLLGGYLARVARESLATAGRDPNDLHYP